MGQAKRFTDEGERDLEQQIYKHENKQLEENADVKNEDAYFKLLAMNAMKEKKRRKNIHATRKDTTLPYEVHTFDEWYKTQLEAEAKRDARPIHPEEYEPKHPIQTRKTPYRTLEQR